MSALLSLQSDPRLRLEDVARPSFPSADALKVALRRGLGVGGTLARAAWGVEAALLRALVLYNPMMPQPRALIVLLAAAGLQGCAPVDAPSNAERMEGVVEVRLGHLEGDGADVFGRVTGLALDGEGRIHIMDLMSQEVGVFSPSGEHLHTLGGRGEGPGQFTMATAITVSEQGDVLVGDPGTGRYTLFGPDGGLKRTVAQEHLAGRPPAVAGEGFITWRSIFPDEGPGVVVGERLILEPVVLDSMLVPGGAFPAIEFRQAMVPGGSRPVVFHAPKLLVAVDGDDLWVADGRHYRVHRRTLPGDTSLTVDRPARPAAVGAAERDALAVMFGNRPDVLRSQLDMLPEMKPVLQALAPDGAGRLFVLPELEGVPSGSVLDLFGADGEYIGRVDLPEPVALPLWGPVLTARGDRIAYVAADPNDVPRVVVLRLTGG